MFRLYKWGFILLFFSTTHLVAAGYGAMKWAEISNSTPVKTATAISQGDFNGAWNAVFGNEGKNKKDE